MSGSTGPVPIEFESEVQKVSLQERRWRERERLLKGVMDRLRAEIDAAQPGNTEIVLQLSAQILACAKELAEIDKLRVTRFRYRKRRRKGARKRKPAVETAF